MLITILNNIQCNYKQFQPHKLYYIKYQVLQWVSNLIFVGVQFTHEILFHHFKALSLYCQAIAHEFTNSENSTTLKTWPLTLIGAWTRPPYLCIVTNFMYSGDLVPYIQHYGRFSKYVARQIMIKLVVGIKFIRENNLIHRDSKP